MTKSSVSIAKTPRKCLICYCFRQELPGEQPEWYGLVVLLGQRSLLRSQQVYQRYTANVWLLPKGFFSSEKSMGNLKLSGRKGLLIHWGRGDQHTPQVWVVLPHNSCPCCHPSSSKFQTPKIMSPVTPRGQHALITKKTFLPPYHQESPYISIRSKFVRLYILRVSR